MTTDTFPHDDILDLRDLLADEDTVAVTLAALCDAGLAQDLDDAQAYADDEPTLVAGRYFQEYARDLADDSGLTQDDAEWPARHIDWAAAAEELQQDYCELVLAGECYWVRSI